MRRLAIRSRIGLFLASVPIGIWILFAAMAGGVLGLGTYTFSYAQGTSYLSDNPQACANCHVMQEVYAAWNHGSHKAVATCNDCHVPHALVTKYAVKMYDGWNHSYAFTTDQIPEPIRIGSFDRGIAEENCLACHGDMVVAVSQLDSRMPTDCLHCHSGVGHNLAK